MEIRDPLHGPIQILAEETPIVESPFFQRLRNIKQLGLSEYVFPGATHTRFLHSLGVMKMAERVFDKLFAQSQHQQSELQRLKETFKMAALLHDVGHAPLSHATESVMPPLAELKLDENFLWEERKRPGVQANHEDYTLKAILDGPLSAAFSLLTKNFGVSRERVAELILGRTRDPAYFTYQGTNYFPLFHQLVSSELDCDRMDYLLRDSYFCGVSYGKFDLDWLLDNLRICPIQGEAYLGISERAIFTFDDFLLSRFHMFLMVYFHYRAVCLEQLLLRYFQTSQEYRIPSQMDEFLKHDDTFLMEVLKNSTNRYAQQIVKNSIPKKIFETYGATDVNKSGQLEQVLKEKGLEYIKTSSKGRLSKYWNETEEAGEKMRPQYPIKVVREYPFGDQKFHNIHEATNLFERYSETHVVTRIYCDLNSLPPLESQKICDMIDSVCCE